MSKKKSDWQNRIVGHDTKPASWFLANEANWRIHPKNQQESLGGVLDEVGWVQDVIVNKRTGEEWGADQNVETLVDGHLRITLALRNGDDTPVPVKFVDLSPDEEALILLSLDPIGAMAASDKVKLDELMQTVQSEDERVQTLMAELADKEGIEYGKAEPPEDVEPQIDKAEELRKKWGVETGQLWALGNHRIICGDCTDKAVVDKLMGGEKVSLVVTDPPYGVDYEGGANNQSKREKLTGDGDTILYSQFLKVAPIDDKCAMYLWHAGRRANEVYEAAISAGFEVRAQIIWHKLKAHYGAWMAQYLQKHEPCIYCVRNAPEFIGASNEVTVWEYDQPKTNEYHPTQKPVELMERAIGNHPYKFVYEPFSGSGTTIIACERLNRKCRAIEISPAYVAVAIQRWVDVTGGEPELISTE